MDMICLTIDMRATGENIHQMMQQNGYCVHDVQTAMGFEYPQAVYKWLNGKTLPSVDNLMILSMLFHKSINDILVTTGGGAFLLRVILNHQLNDRWTSVVPEYSWP